MGGVAIIGITIGVGEVHAPLAAKAAEAAQRFYHLDKVLILGERELNQFTPDWKRFDQAHDRIYYLKWLAAFLGYERWVWLDADYLVLREPSQDELDMLHNESRLMAVPGQFPECSHYTFPYYCAGFYVANQAHKSLFDWCIRNYFKVDKLFAEQCVWNRGIHELKIEVLELDRRWNRALPETINPIAHHGLI